MNKLDIKNFKAHIDLEVPFAEKNFLLFGDNGAGKSSIYEALKVLFFKEKLANNITSQIADENEHAEAIKEFWREYNNSQSATDFILKLNDNQFNRESYQVFMFDIDSLFVKESIYLETLIQNVDFDINISYLDRYIEIEDKANNMLSLFLADISLEIEKEDHYCIKITDINRDLIKKKDIVKYFNEAKLNLVIFSLLFSIVEIMKDENKKSLLILDDFITSLDMANRTFIMKYILKTFSNDNTQIVILTHNVYFYNLIIYLINDVYKLNIENKKWQYANLYEIGASSKISLGINEIKISEIEASINDNMQPAEIESVGNKIRKKFEILLYELSKSLMIGSVEESDKIIKTIENKKMCVIKDNKNAVDLLLTIETLINEPNPQNLVSRIQSKINDYKIDELEGIQKIIQELKIYRKVSMHSLSHGRIGQHSFSDKEIKHSIKLLKKLESKIKSLDTSVQRRTDGM